MNIFHLLPNDYLALSLPQCCFSGSLSFPVSVVAAVDFLITHTHSLSLLLFLLSVWRSARVKAPKVTTHHSKYTHTRTISVESRRTYRKERRTQFEGPSRITAAFSSRRSNSSESPPLLYSIVFIRFHCRQTEIQ